MLVECKNQEFMTAYLNNTMSCSHPDLGRMYSEKESRHCGYCLPCVIRQAAILHAGINDNGSYRDRLFESGPNAKTIRNSYLLGLKKFNPDVAFMTIQLNGPIDTIDFQNTIALACIVRGNTAIEKITILHT